MRKFDSNSLVLHLRCRNASFKKDLGSIAKSFSLKFQKKSILLHADLEDIRFTNQEFYSITSIKSESRILRFLFTCWKILNLEMKSIEIAILLGGDLDTVLIACLIKLINKKCFTIIKLDLDERASNAYFNFKEKIPLYFKIIQNYGLVNSFICETSANYKKVKSYFDMLNKPLYFVPNGALFEVKKIENLAKQKIILSIGRDSKNNQKKLSLILKVFNIFNKEKEDWKLFLVSPNMTDKIKNKYLLNHNNVTIINHDLDKKELSKLYKASAIYFSLSEFESFGYTIQEASLYNCIMVVTNVGCIRDLEIPKKYLYLIENQNYDINSVKKMLLDAADIFEKNETIKYKSKIFTWEDFVESILKIKENNTKFIK
tara:strand:- start:1531 stop:2649 length:1119 start_codon:yes stop_codon:yes gene_type:complete